MAPSDTTDRSASKQAQTDLIIYIVGGIAGFIVLAIIIGVSVWLYCRWKKQEKEKNEEKKQAKEKLSVSNMKSGAIDDEDDDATYGTVIGFCRRRGKKDVDPDQCYVFPLPDDEKKHLTYHDSYNFRAGSSELIDLELELLRETAVNALEIIKEIK
uniref:Uncharacterized protein n=1 Tax=Panagrolaimus sp. JU765 TaxID=591449 RepID=A0AC34R390_9BILA